MQITIVMHTTKNVSNVVGALNPKREREKICQLKLKSMIDCHQAVVQL